MRFFVQSSGDTMSAAHSPLRWAFIGASTIAGQWMVNAIRAVGDEVVAVVSGDLARARAFAQQHGIAHALDAEAGLTGLGVNAVYISSTNEKHEAQTLFAAAQGWHVLQADWPLPCATLKQAALKHNVGWMQRLVSQAGVSLMPHGKTTMSPELFHLQLDEGAWGITFATVGQLAAGVAAGVRRAVLANQVLLPHDLSWLNQLHTLHPGLQAPFLLDSVAQLNTIEN
jgi:hypothetical protein